MPTTLRCAAVVPAIALAVAVAGLAASVGSSAAGGSDGDPGAFSVPGAPGPSEPTGPDLAAIARAHAVPGLTAARDDGGRVSIIAAGRRSVVAESPVTSSDLWHIGSCTKAITATLLATYVAEGRVRWTTTLADALPELADEMSPTARRATLAQLVRHRAGMPASVTPALWVTLRGRPVAEGRAALVRDALSRAAAADEAEDEPGFTYSNGGYVVAGAICERLGGAPWEQLVAARLMQPLDIDAFGFGPPPAGDEPGAPAQPVGHAGGVAFPPSSPAADNPAALGPAGTMHLSMAAWARFVRLHLEGPSLADGERDAIGLSRADYAELHRPAGPHAAGWAVGTRAWARGEGPDDRGLVLTHAGSNTRWFAVAWLAPERDFSLLAVANAGDQPGGPAATDAAVAAMLPPVAGSR